MLREHTCKKTTHMCASFWPIKKMTSFKTTSLEQSGGSEPLMRFVVCIILPIFLQGKFAEESSNITCSFYAFRKLRMTRNGYLMVDGYLDPVKDPKETDIELWSSSPAKAPSDVDLAKIKYILGLIGDQFCNMVQQERKCLSLHMSSNKVDMWPGSRFGKKDLAPFPL